MNVWSICRFVRLVHLDMCHQPGNAGTQYFCTDLGLQACCKHRGDLQLRCAVTVHFQQRDADGSIHTSLVITVMTGTGELAQLPISGCIRADKTLLLLRECILELRSSAIHQIPAHDS